MSTSCSGELKRHLHGFLLIMHHWNILRRKKSKTNEKQNAVLFELADAANYDVSWWRHLAKWTLLLPSMPEWSQSSNQRTLLKASPDNIYTYHAHFYSDNDITLCYHTYVNRWKFVVNIWQILINPTALINATWWTDDGWLAILRPFQQYFSHIIYWWEVDNERLCAMELCLQLKRFHRAGLELPTTRSVGQRLTKYVVCCNFCLAL